MLAELLKNIIHFFLNQILKLTATYGNMVAAKKLPTSPLKLPEKDTCRRTSAAPVKHICRRNSAVLGKLKYRRISAVPGKYTSRRNSAVPGKHTCRRNSAAPGKHTCCGNSSAHDKITCHSILTQATYYNSLKDELSTVILNEFNAIK